MREMKMVSTFCLLITLAAMMTIFTGASKEYIVGDDDGWRLPDYNDTDMYAKWASRRAFRVGDSIVFKYQNDSVVRVDKRGYYHCNESSHERVFDDGDTIFLLDKQGFFYFVSGDVKHCKKGQRLMVDVKHSNSSSISPVSSFGISSSSPPSVAFMAASIVATVAWCPSQRML